MAIALQIRDTEGAFRCFAADEQVRIGRDPSQVTVVVDNEYVSRLHCILQRRLNGQWILIHRGRNPSWIDGRDLRRPGEQALLRDRSALTIGGTVIELMVDEQPDPERDIGVSDPELGDSELHWEGQEPDESIPGLDEETLIDHEIPVLDLQKPGHPSHREEVPESLPFALEDPGIRTTRPMPSYPHPSASRDFQEPVRGGSSFSGKTSQNGGPEARHDSPPRRRDSKRLSGAEVTGQLPVLGQASQPPPEPQASERSGVWARFIRWLNSLFQG